MLRNYYKIFFKTRFKAKIVFHKILRLIFQFYKTSFLINFALGFSVNNATLATNNFDRYHVKTQNGCKKSERIAANILLKKKTFWMISLKLTYTWTLKCHLSDTHSRWWMQTRVCFCEKKAGFAVKERGEKYITQGNIRHGNRMT